jgi:hypothetical protein
VIAIPKPAAIAGDEVSRIIALLDAAKLLGGYVNMIIFADQFAEGVGEYSFRLWASTHNIGVSEMTIASGTRCITLDGNDAHISIQVPPTAEIREPAPGIEIEVANDETTRFDLMELE